MSLGPTSLGPAVTGNSVIRPVGEIRAIAGRSRPDSTNQTFPSGPLTMPRGALLPVGIAYSVRTPEGVRRPMRLVQNSVNQMLPSGPAVMLSGPLPNPAPGFCPALSFVIAPAGVTRRIQSGLPFPPPLAVTYRFPSEPAAIVCAPPATSTGTLNCLTCPAGEILPMTSRLLSTNQMFPSGPRARLATPGRHAGWQRFGWGTAAGRLYSTIPPLDSTPGVEVARAAGVEVGWAADCPEQPITSTNTTSHDRLTKPLNELAGAELRLVMATTDLERIGRASLKELGDIRIDDVLSFIDRGIENMPSYLDLYRRWEAQQWAVSDIDFSLDRRDWLESTELEKKATLWSHRLFFNGEERVTSTLAPFVWAAPTPEIEVFLSTQMVDEARHTVFFEKWWREVCGTGARDMTQLLKEIRPEANEGYNTLFYERLPATAQRLASNPRDFDAFVEGVTLYHIVIEATIALTGQRFELEAMREQGLTDRGVYRGFTAVARDASRHVS